MADLIQIRRDTAENWAFVNPILKLGEIGFVTVSGSMTNPIQFKVGDGTLQWNNLPLQYGSSFESITLGETVYYPEDGSRSIVLPEIGGSSSVMPGSGENSAQQSGSGAEASGEGAFAEGDGVASGDYSHAEGRGTEATHNEGEHAEGKWNKSNADTISSIGIGTSANDRKNAVEVMKNGDMYVKGVGGYDGTNPGNADDVASVISGKQATLESGTNIKTINGQSILGAGDITIQGGGSEPYFIRGTINFNQDPPAVTITSGTYVEALAAYNAGTPVYAALTEGNGAVNIYPLAQVISPFLVFIGIGADSVLAVVLQSDGTVMVANSALVHPSALAQVATTGNYNDLENKPVIQDMYISGIVDTYGSFVPSLGSTSFVAAVAAFKAGRDIKLVYSDSTISRYYNIVGYYGDLDGEGDFLYAFSPILTAGGNLQIVRWYNPN